MRREVDALAVVLDELLPGTAEALAVCRRQERGEITVPQASAQIRLIAKQKREREAKQRLEEMKVFMAEFVKQAKRKGTL